MNHIHPQLKEGIQILKKRYGSDPEIQVFAPARANLLGDHEDYNEGFVLPFALPLKTFIVGSTVNSTAETTIHTRALFEDHTVTFELTREGLKKKEPKWANYLKTVILEYLDDLPPGLAFQAVITSNIPIGYGLGSSVALEVAMATFLEKICAMKHMSPVTRSLRCHKADAALGYKSRGISDHFATTLAVSGDLLLVDCQSKDYQLVGYLDKDSTKPPPVLVITQCQKKQPNYQSQLAAQVRTCREVASAMQAVMPEISSLRAAGLDDLDIVKDQLDDVAISRAHFVITENSRTLAAVRFLSSFDYKALGEVMNQSYNSMKESCETITPEIQFLVEESLEVPGVLGSKMTGYGYGGCIVTLIERHSSRTLELHLKKRFKEEFNEDCCSCVCVVPGTGAGDCLARVESNAHSSKRYKPATLPEDRGEVLTKRLLPVAIIIGLVIGIWSAMLVTRNTQEIDE